VSACEAESGGSTTVTFTVVPVAEAVMLLAGMTIETGYRFALFFAAAVQVDVEATEAAEV